MRDEQTGEIIGCLGILQDITARKIAQEELRRQSDFVDTILQTLDVLVVVLDKEGRIQLINQACEQLMGQSLEAVKGKQLWDLFVFGDDAELERRAQQKLLSGQSPIEYELVWADARRNRAIDIIIRFGCL